jgi:Na+/phosphate symporter
MEDVLRIEAAQRADAKCIADALAEYNASVEPQGSVVLITGMNSGTLVTAALDALKACLDANAIAAVKVLINGQHYVMEGAPDA